MPQWKGSDRRSRLPDDWPRLRRRILQRDGFRCTAFQSDDTRCPEPATDVDHIRPGDDHRETNLTSLCAWHHQQKSAREGAAAAAMKRRRAANKYRRVEKHPGEL